MRQQMIDQQAFSFLSGEDLMSGSSLVFFLLPAFLSVFSPVASLFSELIFPFLRASGFLLRRCEA